VDAERVDQSSVAVEVEVDSLVVREGTGGVKPLTDRDRADIHRTMTGRILDAARHPTITYSSAAVRATGGHGVVSGTLTIRGVERPLDIAFTVDESDPAVTRFDAVATVVQSLWGIRPYSGFFGALKLRDEVRVTVSLQLPAAR
jgi:polyisoprenoid-binding protein YceI